MKPFDARISNHVPIIEREPASQKLLGIVKRTADNEINRYPRERTVFGATIIEHSSISRALRTHQYPDKSSSSDPNVVPILLDLVRQKEGAVRNDLIEKIDAGETFSLKPHELALLQTFCLAGDAAEELYLAWQRDMDLPITKNTPKLTNIYTIPVEKPDGSMQEQTWATRYPDEIAQITNRYSQLAEKLQDMPDEEAQKLRKVVISFTTLLATTDSNAIKNAGDEFDTTWMDYQGDVQFIFPRDEGYAGRQAYPEMRLVIVDKTQAEDTQQMKQALREYLSTVRKPDRGQSEIIATFSRGLEQTQLMPSYYLNETGITTLRPAAESLPNEEIPRAEKGTRIYIMIDALESRWKEAEPLMRHLTAPSQEFFSHFDSTAAGIFFALAHEFAEPFAETTKLRDILGSRYGHINEDLATKFGNAAARNLEKTHPGVTKDHCAYLAYSTLRYINNALTDPTLQNYMVMAYKELDELFTTGVMQVTPDNRIHFDFSDEKVEAWSHIAGKNLRTLIGITEYGQQARTIDDGQKTQAMIESYLSLNETNWRNIQSLIRIMHPNITSDIEIPFTQLPT